MKRIKFDALNLKKQTRCYFNMTNSIRDTWATRLISAHNYLNEQNVNQKGSMSIVKKNSTAKIEIHRFHFCVLI